MYAYSSPVNHSMLISTAGTSASWLMNKHAILRCYGKVKRALVSCGKDIPEGPTACE